MTPRIALDHYVYEDVYPAFKAATDEKAITAKITRAFLNYLAQRNQILTGDTPLAVADIGSGPCDTLVMYLEQVNFVPGFEVRATDFIPAYADAQTGEALRILAAAQTSRALKLVGFSSKAGDAFGGELPDLLSGPRDGARMRRAFRIVFASHMMYHAEGAAAVERLVADVANNLLAADGICIMYHLAAAPGTFQDFRARFGSQADAARDSNTGAVTIDDPPARIAAVCAALRLPLFESNFTTSLRFGKVEDNLWQSFKNPRGYEEIATSNPAAYEDLKRLYFVVQRAPLEFAADDSATGLAAFIDEIRRVIEANPGVLPLAERMQVFCRTDAPLPLRESIQSAVAASIASAC
ncbi:MAG: hypothetical protein ABSD31_15085 [Candidatus Binataceae bacterium]